jgi:hypothetical protein
MNAERVAFVNVPDGVTAFQIEGSPYGEYTYGYESSHNNKTDEVTIQGATNTSTCTAIKIVDSYRTSVSHTRIKDVGVAVQLETASDWTEATKLSDVEIVNPIVGIKCVNSGGSGSLARTEILGTDIDLQRANAVGWDFPDGMMLDRSKININVWINHAGTSGGNSGKGTTAAILAGEADAARIYLSVENFVTTNPPIRHWFMAQKHIQRFRRQHRIRFALTTLLHWRRRILDNTVTQRIRPRSRLHNHLRQRNRIKQALTLEPRKRQISSSLRQRINFILAHSQPHNVDKQPKRKRPEKNS